MQDFAKAEIAFPSPRPDKRYEVDFVLHGQTQQISEMVALALVSAHTHNPGHSFLHQIEHNILCPCLPHNLHRLNDCKQRHIASYRAAFETKKIFQFSNLNVSSMQETSWVEQSHTRDFLWDFLWISPDMSLSYNTNSTLEFEFDPSTSTFNIVYLSSKLKFKIWV